MTTINLMSFRHSAFYTPYLLTMGAGLLKQHGLQYQYSVATPTNTVEDSINKGLVDVSQYAVAASFDGLLKQQQSDLVHFAQINKKDGFFIVARQPQPPFKWQDLIGKTILVDHLFQPLATFKYVLHQQGVAINELNIVDAGSTEQMQQRFLNGEGDYIHLQGPYAQKLVIDGAAQIQTTVGEALGDLAFSSLCCNKNHKNKPQIKTFCLVYKEALQMAVNLPAKELAHHIKHFFPKINFNILIETIHYYQQMGCWSTDKRISKASFDLLQDVFIFNKLIKVKFDYKQLII